MKNILGLPVYVFLIPVAGILHIYANNSTHVEISQVVTTLVAATALTACLLLAGRLLFGNPHRPSMILGLNFIHLFLTSSTNAWHMAALTVILATLSAILTFKYSESLRTVTPILNLAAIASVAIPLGTLAFNFQHTEGKTSPKSLPPPSAIALKDTAPHNIFFILADGYARSDVLEKYYNTSNASFDSQLEELGFHIARESWANYSQTALSLASLLNLDYLDELVDDDLLTQGTKRSPLYELINSSKLVHIFEESGYESVSFRTGYSSAELTAVDKVISLGVIEFPLAIIEATSAARILRRVSKSYGYSYDNHRQRVIEGLERLPTLVDNDKRRFIFAHFLSPHPPFVLSVDGPVTPREVFRLRDGSHWHQSEHGRIQEYRDLYSSQLNSLNEHLIESIRAIIEKSAGQALIFLFSDHGPGSNLHYGSLSDSDPLERMANLQALYWQGAGTEALDQNISLINATRMILSQLSIARLPRLPDRMCISEWESPLICHDVTDTLISRK